jgi:hypothetical protein
MISKKELLNIFSNLMVSDQGKNSYDVCLSLHMSAILSVQTVHTLIPIRSDYKDRPFMNEYLR